MSDDALEMLDWRCLTREDDNPRAFGQVRNNSDQTLSVVNIEGAFRDGEGLLLSVGGDMLFDVAPGTVRNFEIDFMDAPDGAEGKCELTNVRWAVEDD